MNEKNMNKGYLYPNLNKNKPSQPDLNGKIVLQLDCKALEELIKNSTNGKIYLHSKISAWENKDNKGNKYNSISFSELKIGHSSTLVETNNQSSSLNKNQSSTAKNSNSNKFNVADLESELDQILKDNDDENNPFNQ
jgi:CRISPR/Cas system-associated protein Cas7 (RAMP superfamily)